MASPFPTPASAAEAEGGSVLMPRFDRDGLLTCVATDAASGAVVMVAHMNAEALRRTIASGEAHYWSRSRGRLWRKGEESGHVQRVVEMRVDCDQDAVWIQVATALSGANCHTGRKSCFYRTVALGADGGTLAFTGDDPLFDPAAVYPAAKQP
jgi:phosphoribosyl-AMP cyclohydrolase